MEDPVAQAAKKKPAFAFWERQRKDSSSSPSGAPPSTSAAASASSATSPSTARRIDALERGTSVSPSTQRSVSSQQTGASPAASGLSGVQRLIQQYSQSGSGSTGASTSSSNSLDRSPSGRRHAASPLSSRIASSSNLSLSSGSDAKQPSAKGDASPIRSTFSNSAAPLPTETSATSISASEPPPSSIATDSSATPTSRLSTEVVPSQASSMTRTASASSTAASTSHRQEAKQPDSSKESDTEKAKRRRRLLQEQLRKRNSKRRSAGGMGVNESPSYSSDEAEDVAAAQPPSVTPSVPSETHPHPTHARTPSASSRRARLISESDSNAPIGSGTESDPYHDAPSRLVTPSKPSTAAPTTNLAAASARRTTARPPSFEDTRPWLEFSPLLPDGELLESPEKAPAPSFALLHQSAPSDLSASASQSSAATDPNGSGSMRPSPSRSNSASLLASDSPVSPTGLGFSTPPGYPSPTSYLSIGSPTQSTHARAYRTTKLPPPRPTPQAPLPPPPSVASSTASTGSRTAAAPTRSARSSSFRNAIPPPSLQDEADVFGGPTLRSRSYSLEQEVASADEQVQPRPPPHATSSAAEATVPTAREDRADAAAASTLAVPMIRQRSNSLQRKDRETAEAPSRPAKLTQTISSPPNAVPVSSLGASSQPQTMGRPRGFTVGAVPGPPGSLRAGAPIQAPAKSRPRSLLSNEIFPLDLAEPRYKSKSGRADDDDSARKTYSMDIDRRVSSLSSNATPSSRGSAGVGITRGLSATSASERDGSSGSAERLVPDASDRRPSVGGRSRSGSSASLLQQVNSQPKSHASFVIAVVGHAHSGKSTVIKKGLRQFGLSKPHVLSEKVTSHSTVCVVDQEQRTIEVLEIDASVLLNGPSKRFAWPKFLPNIDAVILCYDASEIASFRGMSELLENFAVANLSTVMLACKSEVHPKAVDPYYASDMACIYNVGLAECTVQSEEGKKRMRDCFSYLVKEVAKARSGRARRGPASTVPPIPATMSSQRSQSPGAPGQAVPQTRTASNTSQASSQSSLPASGGDAALASSDPLPSPAAPIDSLRARGYSNASSALSRGTAGISDASTDEALTASVIEQTTQAMSHLDMTSDSSSVPVHARTGAPAASADTRFSPRKMSSATVASAISDAPSFQSEEDVVLHDSLQRAQMGLQNARSSGGYVSIDELWDKLFHAAISRTDERFVTMFMVFYRGFATPMDLLEQMMARFDTLTAEDVADGLVHRFALIRLTNMLGDWVLDYPGDLSHPDAHALLIRYHRQLLQHPDTVHTASQIHAAIDATAHAVDLDALWSKAVNSDQTRHKSAIAAAIAGAQPAGAGAETDGAGGGLQASHSSGSASGLGLSSGNTSHDFDGHLGHGIGRSAEEAYESHERTGSESSLPMQSELGGINSRSRSASDLTTSSTEGVPVSYQDAKQLSAPSSGVSTVSGFTQTSGNSAGGSTSQGGTATNASAASSTANLGSGAETLGGGSGSGSGVGRALDQKTALRSISNLLMEVDDETIATELTRLEWAFFTAIQPRDLLRHILVPHDKRDGPVSRSISHFNYISNWVCSMILAQGKTKHRARMLEKFFNIASILRHDNNYGSLNSVLGGLSKTAVHRLKHTRELLKGKSVNKAYQSLVRLMSNERSSAAYRLALENSDGPTIPYVGVHLQDILSISDGNPSKRASDGMIHWRKFSLMDEAVMAVARCQQYDRYIRPNPAVERLIVDVPIMDDEALYERSLLVEPRSNTGTSVGASKIKDLKTFLSNQTYSSSSFHA